MTRTCASPAEDSTTILVVSSPDDPYAFPRNLLRGLKFSGLLAVHIVIALLGTAVLESSLHRTIRPNSIATVLWKEWILSAAIAFGLGFSGQRLWQNTAAKWAWVLPALWFGFGTLLAVGGENAKAKAAYQEFLSLWKDADPDLPILKHAKAEYGKLK